VSILVKIG